MILDILNNFSASGAVTLPTATGTSLIGSSYITLIPPLATNASPSMDEGMGADLIWYLQVSTAVTCGSSTSLQFVLLGDTVVPTTSSSQVALSTPVTVSSGSSLAVGTQYQIKIPRGFSVKYLAIGQINTGAVLTGGAIQSWVLNDDVQDNKSYSAGYTVL